MKVSLPKLADSNKKINKWKILQLIIAFGVLWNACEVRKINSIDQRRGQDVELTNVVFTHLDKFYSSKQRDLAIRMVDGINPDYAQMIRDSLAQEDENPDASKENEVYFVWVGGNAKSFNSKTSAEEFLKAVKILDENICVKQFNSGHYVVVKGLLNQADAQQAAIKFGNAGYSSYLSIMSRFKDPSSCK